MTIRLFLGISPDNLQRKMLGDLQGELAAFGRAVRVDNLHMTLFFVGTVEDKSAAKFVKAIDALSWKRFTVSLHSMTFWRKPKILCLAGKVEDVSLQRLSAAIRRIAHECGFAKPPYKFNPHITLIRKAKELPSKVPAVFAAALILRPSAMHLYQSISHDSGVEYKIIKSWPLQ